MTNWCLSILHSPLSFRSSFELVAKDALQKALDEKLDVGKALAVTEERLLIAQNECDDIGSLCQNTQKDLLQLVEKFTAQSENMDDLTRTYQVCFRRHKSNNLCKFCP